MTFNIISASAEHPQVDIAIEGLKGRYVDIRFFYIALRETVLLALLHTTSRPTVSRFLLYLVFAPTLGLRHKVVDLWHADFYDSI